MNVVYLHLTGLHSFCLFHIHAFMSVDPNPINTTCSAGILWAPHFHLHKKHIPPMVFVFSQSLMILCCIVKHEGGWNPFLEVSCSAHNVHCAPLKGTKACMCLDDLCILEMWCKEPTPFSWQMPETKNRQRNTNAYLSATRNLEYRETQMQSIWFFIHCIPMVFLWYDCESRLEALGDAMRTEPCFLDLEWLTQQMFSYSMPWVSHKVPIMISNVSLPSS